MLDEIKKLRQLVREMRKLGVKALQTDAISITLADGAPISYQSKRQGKESIIEGIPSSLEPAGVPPLSKEEEEYRALMWSVQDN